MNRPRQARWWLAVCAAGPLAVFTLCAQDAAPPVKSFSGATNLVPVLPRGRPPVDFFRQLLAMTLKERADFLTNKPPEFREHILAKIREYQALNPDERELRLRATELRWYLLPFLHEPATNHAARLARVPDDLRGLVKARVTEWEILPPPLQQEFLENERTLRYFAHVDATNAPPPPGHDDHHDLRDADQTRWNALSDDKRRQLTNRFNQFFELTPVEKEKALNSLSATERAQMETTLQSFDKLSPLQRRECVRAFTKFASMNPEDRAEFLKNAEHWSQLSPGERQAWRDLVVHVPKWPPLPTAAIMPPSPTPFLQRLRPTIVTNTTGR